MYQSCINSRFEKDAINPQMPFFRFFSFCTVVVSGLIKLFSVFLLAMKKYYMAVFL